MVKEAIFGAAELNPSLVTRVRILQPQFHLKSHEQVPVCSAKLK